MNTYTIETDHTGGFQVRVTGPHGEPGHHVTTGFPTRAAAQEWIDSQTQLVMKNANASDVA
jgi:hypothetical protein